MTSHEELQIKAKGAEFPQSKHLVHGSWTMAFHRKMKKGVTSSV